MIFIYEVCVIIILTPTINIDESDFKFVDAPEFYMLPIHDKVTFLVGELATFELVLKGLSEDGYSPLMAEYLNNY